MVFLVLFLGVFFFRFLCFCFILCEAATPLLPLEIKGFFPFASLLFQFARVNAEKPDSKIFMPIFEEYPQTKPFCFPLFTIKAITCELQTCEHN